MANPLPTSALKSAGSYIQKSTNDAFKVEEGFKPGATDSESSSEGSDISGVSTLEPGSIFVPYELTCYVPV
jgi:hypothetical protein